MQRLGLNQGSYAGEKIDIQAVLTEIEAAAAAGGWRAQWIAENPQRPLLTLRRSATAAPGAKRLYLSSGIHGDEPAGPLAILELLRWNGWRPDVELFLCPCLNPTGFALNRRENADGIDLNRDYRRLATAEVRAHVRWLAEQPPFDLSLILHEDWEANGFYVYEVNRSGRASLAEAIIAGVRAVCPIETAGLVDHWPASQGIIRPRLAPEDRPQWPEAVYMIQHKTSLGYTLEAPSDYPLPVRVGALTAAVRTAAGLL